jgi:hypothetical protein
VGRYPIVSRRKRAYEVRVPAPVPKSRCRHYREHLWENRVPDAGKAGWIADGSGGGAVSDDQIGTIDEAIDRCMVAIVDAFHEVWGGDVDEATKRLRLDGFLSGRLSFRVRRDPRHGVEILTDAEPG